MTSEQLDRIIEMAWEDRTPFEAIEYQFGLMEKDVIGLMRQTLKPGSFRCWRKRVSGRKPSMRPRAMPNDSEQLAITKQHRKINHQIGCLSDSQFWHQPNVRKNKQQ